MPIDRRTLLTGGLANASGIAMPRPPMASVLGAHMPARAADCCSRAALLGLHPALDGGDHPLPEAAHCANRRQPIG